MKYSIMHINNRAKNNIDRTKEILKNFEYIEIEYFDGINNDGNSVLNNMGIDTSVWRPYDGRSFDPMPGEYGVWVSTVKFFEYMINNEIDKMLLFEDDIFLADNFVSNFNLCLNELPEDFDFLSLYSFNGQNNVDEKTDFGAQHIHRSCNQFSAGQATLYSLKGAKKILKVLKRKGMEYTSDCFIFKQAQLNILNGYSIKKDVIDLLDHDFLQITSIIDPNNERKTNE